MATLLPTNVYALIIGSESAALVGVIDRLTRARQVCGAGFSTTVGMLAGQLCAVAAPADDPPDFERLLAALRTAHEPKLVVGLGISQAQGLTPESIVIASKIVDAALGSYQLTEWSHTLTTGQLGEIHTAPSGDRTDAVWNAWSFPLAATCYDWSLPVVMATAIEVRNELSNEAENVVRRRSLAGKAGALLRLAWRRPSGVSELWRRQSAQWDAQARLAQVAEEAVSRALHDGLLSSSRNQSNAPKG